MSRPRPKITDIAVIESACCAILPEIKVWAGKIYDADAMLRDLVEAARPTDDTYAIAKRLDALGWKPDVILVDILSSLWRRKQGALHLAVCAWVAQGEAPSAKHKPGDRVRTAKGVGRIAAIESLRASYSVVIDHERSCQVVRANFEDVACIETEEAIP